jgi:hypothetical protein
MTKGDPRLKVVMKKAFGGDNESPTDEASSPRDFKAF